MPRNVIGVFCTWNYIEHVARGHVACYFRVRMFLKTGEDNMHLRMDKTSSSQIQSPLAILQQILKYIKDFGAGDVV